MTDCERCCNHSICKADDKDQKVYCKFVFDDRTEYERGYQHGQLELMIKLDKVFSDMFSGYFCEKVDESWCEHRCGKTLDEACAKKWLQILEDEE